MAKDTILKRKLAEAGISQREICRRINRTPQHVNYVVNGVRESRRLTAEILEICEHLRDPMRSAIGELGKAFNVTR